MLTSLALVFLVGLSLGAICQKLKLPRIIGMLITGTVLGPYVLDLLDSSILGISSELRSMALIIILIKAGLSLNLSDLKKVGRPAILMSFLPAVFEIISATIFAPLLLGVTYLDGAIMGAVLGAVSPAVVVPRMVTLMDERRGIDKGIPQLVLAGSSLDDVFVIVVFTTLIGMAKGDGINVWAFVNIPVSVILGIILGGILGLILSWFFEKAYSKNNKIRNSTKVIIILGFSFLLTAIEDMLEPLGIAVSGLIAVMSMSLAIAVKSVPAVTTRLKAKFGKLWIAAEVILFVMVGAAFDITYTMKAGIWAVFVILIGLVFRSCGVLVCLIGTKLNKKEKLYCVLAYLPKATVQAAIGAVPLSMGLTCGKTVLSVAVLSILITAPLGAFAMDFSYKKLLKESPEPEAE